MHSQMLCNVDIVSIGLICRDRSQGWDVYGSVDTATVTCLHECYQVLFQSYSDSHHSNAVLNIIHLGKYSRKDPHHLLEGDLCASTGLSTGSEFQSPGAALGKFGVDFMNYWVRKHHVGPLLFTHKVQMFYIRDLRGCYYFNQGWGRYFRQVPTFTHKCLLFVLQQ